MILLENVSKRYKGLSALDGVDISIEQGEFVFIVGASGAGKSTLIKLLFREELPSAGKIKVCGKDVTKLKRLETAKFRRKLGIVFQDFRLIPTLNVFDNVAFALRATSASKKEIASRVPKVLAQVGLTSKSKKYPDELSGGEQQRVALARAIVNNPEILIADEPTGNVDPRMSRDIVELLNVINKQGTTVLMVTHQHELVRLYQHRVIVLNDGKVKADGKIGGQAHAR